MTKVEKEVVAALTPEHMATIEKIIIDQIEHRLGAHLAMVVPQVLPAVAAIPNAD
jgi:hypothetical protein